jgi:uncharacterized protein with PIN domain
MSALATTIYGYATSVWGWLKWPVQQAVLAVRLNAKVAALEGKVEKLGEQSPPPSPFRRCPECGERDLRLLDRYRYRPDVFDHQRYLHEKWRCYSCNYLDEVNLPEPGG